MAFNQGLTAVGTAQIPFVDPGIRGCLVQNVGTAIITLGGPTVTPFAGPILAVNAPPIWVYGAPVVGELATDFLHAVQSGTAGGSIAWLVPV